MLRLRRSSTHGARGGKVIPAPIKERRYGTHVFLWVTILGCLLMFKQMSLSRFTGWAVVTAFCAGIVLGVLMF
jgi:hypothetical protein